MTNPLQGSDEETREPREGLSFFAVACIVLASMVAVALGAYPIYVLASLVFGR